MDFATFNATYFPLKEFHILSDNVKREKKKKKKKSHKFCGYKFASA
jgi:hypothetical protein